MAFIALGIESPYPKYSSILWESNKVEYYEEVLSEAADFILFISGDYSGCSGEYFSNFLQQQFNVDIDANEDYQQNDDESYVDWMRRVTGKMDLSEKDLPDSDNTGVLVVIKDLDKGLIVNLWDSEPIFHPIKGIGLKFRSYDVGDGRNEFFDWIK